MKFKITEEEKRKILGLYDLLNEQTPPPAPAAPTPAAPTVKKSKEYNLVNTEHYLYKDKEGTKIFGNFKITGETEDPSSHIIKLSFEKAYLEPNKIAGITYKGEGETSSGYLEFSCNFPNLGKYGFDIYTEDGNIKSKEIYNSELFKIVVQKYCVRDKNLRYSPKSMVKTNQ